MIRDYKGYIANLMLDVRHGNEGKVIVIKNGSTYTCIDGNCRYACGKNKTGKFIFIPSLFEYFSNKKIESYCVIDDEKSIDILSDDVKTLEYVKVPTEEQFEQLKNDDENDRQKMFIDRDIKSWDDSFNKSKYSIVGYNLVDSTMDYGVKDVVLDLIMDDGRQSTLYLSSENEYHTTELIKLVEKRIVKLNDTEVCTDDVETASTIDEEISTDDSYNTTMVNYAKSLDVKHYQRLRTQALLCGDVFTYAKDNDLSKDDIELMLYMSKELDENDRLISFPYEFNSTCVDTDDGYLYSDTNLHNVLTHIEKVKSFRNDSSTRELFGNIGVNQGCYYKLVRYDAGEFYSECSLYLSASIRDYNDDKIFRYERFGRYEDVINDYIDFLSKYQLDYIRYLQMIGK